MKKLIVLIASPRKNGNCALLARAAETAAQDIGAAVDHVFLHDLAISPCNGCGVCRESVDSPCVLDDDMTRVYAKLRAVDAVLIATPIYSYDMSAQAKLLIDRLYAMGGCDGNALVGKRFGFIIVSGGSDLFQSGAATAMRCFHDTFARKATWMRMVHGSATGAGDAKDDLDLLRRATQLGVDLVADL